jgi:hypothetical protein
MTKKEAFALADKNDWLVISIGVFELTCFDRRMNYATIPYEEEENERGSERNQTNSQEGLPV